MAALLIVSLQMRLVLPLANRGFTNGSILDGPFFVHPSISNFLVICILCYIQPNNIVNSSIRTPDKAPVLQELPAGY